nr:hypothetical protein [Tanacetum cinerariifolium]
MEKPHEEEPEKTNTEYEVQSMVTVPIHQETYSVPPMTTLVIDLTVSQPVSITVQAPLLTSTTSATTITTTTTTLPPPPPHPQQSTTYSFLIQRIFDEIVTDVVDWAMQDSLQACFSDLPAVDMKEILQQQMFEDKSYEAYKDHKNLFDALQNHHIHLLQQARLGIKVLQERQDLLNCLCLILLLHLLVHQGLFSNKAATVLSSTYANPTENLLLAKIEDMVTFMNRYCRKMKECHKLLTDQIDWANPGGDQVKINVSQPLPLGDPSGHVTIQTQFFFHKDLEYFWHGNKGSIHALSISKIKATRYLNFDTILRRVEKKSEHACGFLVSPASKYTQDTVVFSFDNNERKIMRFNEIYKFSDGTLTNILEALDYIVKEFKFKRLNLDEKDLLEPGMLCCERVHDIDYRLLQRME